MLEREVDYQRQWRFEVPSVLDEVDMYPEHGSYVVFVDKHCVQALEQLAYDYDEQAVGYTLAYVSVEKAVGHTLGELVENVEDQNSALS